MNTLKKFNKAAQKLFAPSKPYIYHFRITKSLTAQTVPTCLDRLRIMKESKKVPRIFALSVNIHCGSPVLTKTLRDAFIQTASDFKAPLYTFAEDCALESGFYLLSAGHKIYANPYSLLGDVSSVNRQIKIEKLVKKYVTVTLIKSGKLKNLGGNFEETSAETVEFLKKLVRVHHEDVVDGIFESRDIFFERKGLKSEHVRDELLSGKTFTASEAVEKGLVDGIMTFEEFKDTYYEGYNVNEFTIGKDEGASLDQVTASIGNWSRLLAEKRENTESSVLESFSCQNVKDRVELADDMLQLLKSDKFVEKLRTFINGEMVGEVYDNIQGRMSMTDIMDFLDQNESGNASFIGRF